MIARIALSVYASCVDFLLAVAALFGVTYRDANAALFFIVFPLVTLALFGLVLWQWRMLRRARRRP